MKRGEIWLINLDPTVGAEIAKRRPALIISADDVGKLPLRVVAPLTSWKAHFQIVPWMVRIQGNGTSGLDKDSSADCYQARSVSHRRMIEKIGEATPEQMAAIEESIQVVMGL